MTGRNMAARNVVALVLGLSLAGCHHRQPKPLAVAPLPPEIGPVMVSVPPPSHPTEPLPPPEAPAVVATVPAPPPVKKPRKRRPPQPTAVTPPVQTAAVTTPTISLGQLSAGGDSATSLRTETEQMASMQRQRLDRLAAPVAAAHGAEIEQIRRFLKGSDDAWKTGDVEGAHTLALKAKVMLDELQR